MYLLFPKKIKPLFLNFFLGIIIILSITSCNSKGESSFFDEVKASSFDNSVEVVVTFLKKNYLKDPDSYKSVEWGKLIKNSDGSFQVEHRFSGKNGFGAVDTETLLFCISKDGNDVHICTSKDESRVVESDRKAKQVLAEKEFRDTDFSNASFEGNIKETIDGITEEYNFKGELSKYNNSIQGDVVSVEKDIKYQITGNLKDNGQVDFILKNLSNGSITNLPGYYRGKNLWSNSVESPISFQLTQIK